MKDNETLKTAVVIVAAGRGSRMGKDVAGPKQYEAIGQKTVLQTTVEQFLAIDLIDFIQIVIHVDDQEIYDRQVMTDSRILPAVVGGKTRQESCRKGLEALSYHEPTNVLIHDAARPFVSAPTIHRVLNSIGPGVAVVPSRPVPDTLRRASTADADALEALETVSRDHIHLSQTPQGFVFDEILSAHRKVVELGHSDLTDDAAVGEAAGMRVILTHGDSNNFKITTPDDLIRARQMTKTKTEVAAPDFRTGIGYDIHRTKPGRSIMLGGIKIDSQLELEGHSDADVALHAITDALLGTIGEGDIGSHFPPSEPEWRGASSDRFIEHACRLIGQSGGEIRHIDLTIICETPKIGPHRERMRRSIAQLCGMAVERVSVKATTNETIGTIGRKEGIAALATATVLLKEPVEGTRDTA